MIWQNIKVRIAIVAVTVLNALNFAVRGDWISVSLCALLAAIFVFRIVRDRRRGRLGAAGEKRARDTA